MLGQVRVGFVGQNRSFFKRVNWVDLYFSNNFFFFFNLQKQIKTTILEKMNKIN